MARCPVRVRVAREGVSKPALTQHISMITRLLWTFAEAELSWRDQHYPMCERRVAFLTSAWGVAKGRQRPDWKDAIVTPPDARKIRGWSSWGEHRELSTTDVLAIVNLNPLSSCALPIWGAVWFNRKERWVRVSWTKTTPTPDRWLEEMVGAVSQLPTGVTSTAEADGLAAKKPSVRSVFDSGRADERWSIRYADSRTGGTWGARSLVFSGWWLWQWWRYPKGGGNRPPTDEKTARLWWERCMPLQASPPSPDLVAHCFAGPLKLSKAPEPPLVAATADPGRSESERAWSLEKEWGGERLPPADVHSDLDCRMVLWNADGWNEVMDSQWWDFLSHGDIDVCCLQDVRWDSTKSERLKRAARGWGQQQLRWTAAPPHQNAPEGVGGTCISSRTTWGARRTAAGVDARGWGRFAWEITAGRDRRFLLTITLYAPAAQSAKWQEEQLDAATKTALRADRVENEVIDAWWLLLTDILQLLLLHRDPRMTALIVGDFNFDPQRDGGLRSARAAIWHRFLREADLVVVSTDQEGRGLRTFERGASSSCIDLVLTSKATAVGFRVGVLRGLQYSSLHHPVVVTIPLETVLGLRSGDLSDATQRARPGRLRRSDAVAVARYQEALAGSPATKDAKATPPLWNSNVEMLISSTLARGEKLLEQPVDPDTGYPEPDPLLKQTMDTAMTAVATAMAKAQKAACRAPKEGSLRQKNGWSSTTGQMGRCLRRVLRITSLLRQGRRGSSLAKAAARAVEMLPEVPVQGGAAPGLDANGVSLIHPLSTCLRQPPAITASPSRMKSWAADLLRLCQALRRAMQGSERKASRLRINEAVATREKGRRLVRHRGLRRFIDFALE